MNFFIQLKKLQNNGGSENIKTAIRALVFSSLIADMKTSTSFNDYYCNNKNIMNDSLACHTGVRSEKPQTTEEELVNIPRENLLINEMIHEYLQFNGCLHTASVFQTELGNAKRDANATTALGSTKFDQCSSELDRVIIEYELGLNNASFSKDGDDNNDIKKNKDKNKAVLPVLYDIISLLKRQKRNQMKEHQNNEMMFYNRKQLDDRK